MLKTKYLKVLFDDETKIYTSVYLKETLDMTDKEWQNQMLEMKTLIEKLKPEFIIDDNSERLYAYSPDMQMWTLDLFINCWNKIGLKKYAQIVPKEIVGKLTSDQIEELSLTKFRMQFKHNFFEDQKSASIWVKEAIE